MFETKLFVIFDTEESTLRDPSIWKPPLASMYLLDPFGSYCSMGVSKPKIHGKRIWIEVHEGCTVNLNEKRWISSG